MTNLKPGKGFMAAVGLVALSAVGYAAGLSGKIAIDGSSTVYPISEAIAEEFGKAESGVRVTVGVSGTGGGFKRFITGDLDISDASRPIKPEEAAAAAGKKVQYIELPIAYDGLTIVVNKDNDWCKSLTVDELKKMFVVSQGAGGGTTKPRVKTWRDVRPEWPDIAVKFYIPGTDSGTFDYFKEAIAGKDKAIRADVSASEDDNTLVVGVAGDKGAIGFFGCAYYFENQDKVTAVAIDDGKGPVSPSVETIRENTYTPLSRPLFIYVNARSAERSEIDAFVKFYLENAAVLSAEVGYVPLPDEIYGKAKANYAARRTGTQFIGAKGTFAEIYK